jgi:D-alanyl-D-alanine carboxypeptidase (penicillin-binding protein 5/6)
VSGLVAAFGAPAHAAPEGIPPPEAYILVDADTGSIITGRNMHEAIPPASTTKIMTALVAAERLAPGSRIPVSPKAANRVPMKVAMQAGTQWSLQDTLASMMLVSANDAAYALAEAAGGSIGGFADIANATAQRYGMRDSTFGDPAGLSDETSYKGGPTISAYDLAIATRNALAVPQIARWAATNNYEFDDPTGLHHTLHNHNKFLPDNGFNYPGANGFKTGYTEIAQHSLVATAARGGRQCIAVILGGVDSGYTWAASLLDQCWAKPKVEATGKFLPPVAVSPYQARTDAQAGFARIAGAPAPAEPPKATATTPATTPATSPAASPVPASGGEDNRGLDADAFAAAHLAHPDAEPTSATTTVASSSGLITTRRLLLLLILLLMIAFVLRRRAVKRRRARRHARQRARAKAMRSGSLPVVDGRYRTGMRTGQPVDSRVRVARTHVDIPREERRTRARSRSSNGHSHE